MTYTIKQGSHYTSGIHLPSLLLSSPASRTYTVNFSQSAWYEPSEGWNVENDWNKLVGWSIGILPWKVPGKPWYKLSSWEPAHHKNSVRVGWRASGTKDDPTIELCLYQYDNGNRTTLTFYAEYQMGEDIFVEMKSNTPQGFSLKTSYKETGGEIHQVYTTKDFQKGPSYSLKPFFGGTFSAPHTMTIDVTQH